ncbi:hypothetical protein GRO01_08730 [Gluconobacter roseus NBRC 3990]|uniref:Uncharacterized protein n=1 Tax=Gluconobacter roseus NBRC 3990 TaxID=1307950 RepID=A0A4Y3M4K5_9PROT|nr:hypothetical protein GRO01_08730 [Gluconobacter roseus NBRC 3990]GLP93755.1 hypothetical protein GCM10007871_17330 [Gluconobacter roseus NBRC 3990]
MIKNIVLISVSGSWMVFRPLCEGNTDVDRSRTKQNSESFGIGHATISEVTNWQECFLPLLGK